MLVCCLDFETVDSRGASFETFRKDFKVSSLSLAWRDVDGTLKQQYSDNPEKINQMLTALHFNQAKIIAHNIGFEQAVTAACYPRLKLNWYSDTLRLAQLRDGGGDPFEATPNLTFEQQMSVELGELTEKEATKDYYKKYGLSLEACARRFLPVEYHDHKKKAHDWLLENAKIKKNFGQYLHLLPSDILQEYNDADTKITLLLYEELIRWCEEENVDWQQDHHLYLMRSDMVNKAYAHGIRVDRDALLSYIQTTEAEVNAIEGKFLEKYDVEIRELKQRWFRRVRDEFCADPTLKSDKAREKRRERLDLGLLDSMWSEFNIGSSQQLAELFTEVMGMTPKFLTPKGSPSLKSSHLSQWGEAGEMLLKRRKRLIVLQQCMNTYLGSTYDGRIHCKVKSSGTKTNRASSG